MHWSQAKKCQAFLVSLNGPEVTFNLPLAKSFPNTGTSGEAAHGWKVGTGAQAGSEWLPVQRESGHAAGAPHVGDYLTIPTSSGSFLHQVVSTVQTDSNGHATGMNVWPRLRRNVVNHAVGFFAQGTFRLKQAPSFSFDAARIMGGLTLELIDAAGM